MTLTTIEANCGHPELRMAYRPFDSTSATKVAPFEAFASSLSATERRRG